MTRGKILETQAGLLYTYAPSSLDPKRPWLLLNDNTFHSDIYNKDVFLKSGMRSDGATGAFDIVSSGWWVHDELCNTGRWADGSPVTNWQASTVLYEILKSEGRYIRARRWRYATFVFGGDKARANGMIYLKAGVS